MVLVLALSLKVTMKSTEPPSFKLFVEAEIETVAESSSAMVTESVTAAPRV